MKQYFLSYRPRTEYGISQFFNIQDDQLWAFSETVQKISKITYTASQFSLLTSAKFAVNINRVKLQHNKEFIMFFYYYLMVLSYNDV